MFVSGPNAPRRPALPVPTRRSARVQPASEAASASDAPDRAPQPVTPPRQETGATPAQPAAIAAQCSSAGISIQDAFPHPRRGLRADASERQRYRRAYDAAQTAAPGPRPQLERSA